MSIYRRYCQETFDADGNLSDFILNCPGDFNFGYDVVDQIAEETPGKRALVWCDTEGEERVFPFGEIKTYSNRMANVFRQAGIGHGDRVMLILKKHYEYWFAAVALHKLGAVAIPATHMLTVGDLVYRITAAQVKAVVCTPQSQVPEKLLAAVEQAGSRAKLWCVREDIDSFENLTAAMERAGEKWERVPTLASDPMLLYFTSGTTGYPKGVIHSHSYPLAHVITAKYWQQAEDGGLHFTVAETGWAKASWGKLYGQWLVGSAVMVYDFDSFDPKQLTQIINRYGVTSFCAPPTVYRYLVRKGIPAMPSLRHACTAGESLAPEVSRRFTQRTGLPLHEGYGQPGIFTVYLDNDAQYDHVWRGGVYHTGDAAWRDESGRYWFLGRFDDIIKTGGYRVGPYEVENVLMEHPAVVECSVIGVPDLLRGQAIKAVVVPGREYPPTKELALELKEFCNRRLAEYKWIRIIEFSENMPKTISGKIQKTAQRRGEG